MWRAVSKLQCCVANTLSNLHKRKQAACCLLPRAAGFCAQAVLALAMLSAPPQLP